MEDGGLVIHNQQGRYWLALRKGNLTCVKDTTLTPASASSPGCRSVAIALHPGRPAALDAASLFVRGLAERGISCVCFEGEPRAELLRSSVPDVDIELIAQDDPRAELLVVFGGDGTILRASEFAVPLDLPMLGVNLGHVGFLAELEPAQNQTLVEKVAAKEYQVESRITIDIDVIGAGGEVVWSSYALNEVSVEKLARERMVEVVTQIDHKPVSRWLCDGVLAATPTGSTAYAFSAGGPVMWPGVDALLVVPLSAHALFARPLVVSPSSIVDIDITPSRDNDAVVWCDGRRRTDAKPGHRVRVRRGSHDLRFARLLETSFTTRLVRKFALPVDGWRTSSGQANA